MSPKKARFLWITDPWDTLDHPRDTTLRLATEAESLGHDSHWCDVKTVRWHDGQVLVDACPVSEAFGKRRVKPVEVSAYSSLHYRTDPPVDLAYLHPLQLLVLGTRDHRKSEIVNPANVLFLANEKLEAARLPELMPPGIASGEWTRLESFGRSAVRTVLKPLYQAQSKGIELLRWKTPAERKRSRELLHAATDGFSRPVLLQKYLPEIEKGEVRLWFLDGECLACIKKLPLEGDFRVNLDRGSRLAPHSLTPTEKRIARNIGKFLRQEGIRLAAVDLIGHYITDFNFTSPGLVSLMEPILERNLASPIIQALARGPLSR